MILRTEQSKDNLLSQKKPGIDSRISEGVAERAFEVPAVRFSIPREILCNDDGELSFGDEHRLAAEIAFKSGTLRGVCDATSRECIDPEDCDEDFSRWESFVSPANDRRYIARLMACQDPENKSLAIAQAGTRGEHQAIVSTLEAIQECETEGFYSWEFQPLQDAIKRYVDAVRQWHQLPTGQDDDYYPTPPQASHFINLKVMTREGAEIAGLGDGWEFKGGHVVQVNTTVSSDLQTVATDQAIDSIVGTPSGANQILVQNAFDFCAEFPEETEPVIDGLIRRGETMNVIGASKAGQILVNPWDVACGCHWSRLDGARDPTRKGFVDR